MIEVRLLTAAMLAIVCIAIVTGRALYLLAHGCARMQSMGIKPEAQLIIPIVAVYSHVSLAHGENLARAEEHIRNAVGKALADGKRMEHILLLFDIIVPQEAITPGQALGLAHQVTDHIQAHYSGVKGRIIGVSNNAKIYTVHDVLLTGKLALADVDNVHQFLIA